jgi:uncharacterized protein YndB with AHSA1/START domain
MPDILHRVGIAAPAAKVYETLTTLEGHRGWWDANATGNAAKGGELTFFGHVFKVTDARPNELVSWKCASGSKDWVNTTIEFRLDHKQDQTFVLFRHADWKEPVEFMHHCSTKWATFLLSLKALVETGKGRPAPDDVHIYVGG